MFDLLAIVGGKKVTAPRFTYLPMMTLFLLYLIFQNIVYYILSVYIKKVLESGKPSLANIIIGKTVPPKNTLYGKTVPSNNIWRNT